MHMFIKLAPVFFKSTSNFFRILLMTLPNLPGGLEGSQRKEVFFASQVPLPTNGPP
jgi:hypothetical protein